MIPAPKLYNATRARARPFIIVNHDTIAESARGVFTAAEHSSNVCSIMVSRDGGVALHF
jgi:hypothetical protein